jgi:hypothetical protein
MIFLAPAQVNRFNWTNEPSDVLLAVANAEITADGTGPGFKTTIAVFFQLIARRFSLFFTSPREILQPASEASEPPSICEGARKAAASAPIMDCSDEKSTFAAASNADSAKQTDKRRARMSILPFFLVRQKAQKHTKTRGSFDENQRVEQNKKENKQKTNGGRKNKKKRKNKKTKKKKG